MKTYVQGLNEKSMSVVLRYPADLEVANGETDGVVPIPSELSENGLGYNNILFIATVLAELLNRTDGDRPILCVEEPEAHLHPQLQVLLGEYFRRQADHPERGVQVLLTTHSPNLASHLPLDALNVLHRPFGSPRSVAAAPMWKCDLTPAERKKLARLVDATKASLFFAKGVLFVEGACEHLLMPELTRHLGGVIEGKGISVVPLHGINFATVEKLFAPSGIGIRCASLRDGDPGTIERDEPLLAKLGQASHWRKFPATATEAEEAAEEPSNIRSFRNVVTLEYDLALPSDNAAFMARVWRDTMGRAVPEFTQENVIALDVATDRAAFVHQAICCASEGKRKAHFAQELAASLAEATPGAFGIPPYIREALAFLGCVPPPEADDVA